MNLAKKLGVSLGLVFSLLTACSKPGEEYVPAFSSKSSYEYSIQFRGLFGQVQTGKAVVRSEGQEAIKGKKYYKQVSVFSGMPGLEPTVTYLRRTPEGVYAISGKDKEGSEYLDTPFPLTVGTVWTSQDPDGPIQNKAEAIESLELFDRHYDNCLKISFSKSKGFVQTGGTMYLAPGIGLVKLIMKAPGGAMDMELQKYSR